MTRPKKWMLRILFALVILIAGVAITAHLIIRSDLPRVWAVDALQHTTGLRITAGSLETGWLGSTTLRDVTLGLPLRDRPFLTLAALQLEHTSLLRIAVRRSVNLSALVLTEPHVYLRQDADGRWNLALALQVLRSALPLASRSDGASGQPTIVLPRVTLTGGTLEVSRPQQETITVSPITLRGRPDDALTWSFQFEAEPILKLSGRLLAGSTWWHEVQIELSDPAALIRRQTKTDPPVVNLGAQWNGQWIDDRLVGQLQLHSLQVDQLTVEGKVALEVGGDSVVVQPHELSVLPGGGFQDPVRIDRGRVRLVRQRIEADRLGVAYRDIQAQFDGAFDLRERTGNCAVSWTARHGRYGLEHIGSLTVDARVPSVGRRTVRATLVSDGSSSHGEWSSRAEITAFGASYRQLDVKASLPRLIWRDDKREIAYDGLAAEVSLRYPHLRLHRLLLPHAKHVQAAGRWDLATREWQFELDAEQWQPPAVVDRTVDLQATARGHLASVAEADLRLRTSGLEASILGSYMPQRDQPLRAAMELQLTATREPTNAQTGGFQADWRVKTQVNGSLQPLALTAEGSLAGRDLTWGAKRLEDLSIPFRHEQVADAATLTCEPFDFAGGRAEAVARWRIGDPDLEIALSCESLKLYRLIAALEWPLRREGLLDGRVDARVPLADPLAVELSGDWRLTDLQGRGTLGDSARGQLAMRDGVVQMDDIRFESDKGSIAGSLTFDVRHKRRLDLTLRANSWPLEPWSPALDQALKSAHFTIGAPEIRLDGDVRLGVDFQSSPVKLQGNGSLHASLLAEAHALGHLGVSFQVRDRTLDVDTLEGELAGGSITGQATIPLDALLESRAEVSWQALDFAKIAEYWPPLAPASGTATGHLSLGKATDVHAPGPMRARLTIEPDQAVLRDLDFRRAELCGFFGRGREFLLEQSELEGAGGRARLWLKMNRHGEQVYAHAKAGLDNIDIQSVARSVIREPDLVKGRVAGELSIVSYTSDPTRLAGSGRLTLTESDLANLNIMALLVDRLGVGRQQPVGHGQVDLALDGHRLRLPRFDYFNRPLHVSGSFAIDDLWKGSESPVTGLAVGTIRPLKETDLKLLDKVDAAVTALHKNMAAVGVRGTLAQPEAYNASLSNVGKAVKRLLSGHMAE